MRTLAILLAALVITLSPAAALAKSDKTPPGQAAKAEKPEPPGQADRTEPPGQAKNDPPGPDGDGPPGQARGSSDGSDQNEARRAVEASEALPLARIVTIAETRTDGHVIDARLVRVEGTLLYQLTLLDTDGRSWREYYYARTGKPVVVR